MVSIDVHAKGERMLQIGITERGDAAINKGWIPWVMQERKPAILVTKDPRLLWKSLTKSMNIIVHATITGMGGSVLEPNVPVPLMAHRGLEKIISLLGKDRVVLRIDPIMPSEFGVDTALQVLEYGRQNFGDIRVRVSFLDCYRHVYKRFADAGLSEMLRMYNGQIHASLKDRQQALAQLPGNIEICGEPGMVCQGCISPIDVKILNLPQPSNIQFGRQRGHCQCLFIKRELLKNRDRCPHQCLYCYWQGENIRR